MSARKIPLPTKERIIDAAGAVFAQKGFKAATIRQIAKTAHANVASINYYFRDKEGLYRAVLDDIFSKGFQQFPSTCDPEKTCSPEQRLYTFIHAMFHRFLSNKGWQGLSGRGKLIAREFLDPTPAFEDLVQIHIRPQKEILVSILLDLPKSNADKETVLPIAISILGQCVYYAFATSVIQKIAKNLTPTQENLDRLADHVFRFSLAGIQQIDNISINRQWSAELLFQEKNK
jgi:AcrR family transcriptional regulator